VFRRTSWPAARRRLFAALDRFSGDLDHVAARLREAGAQAFRLGEVERARFSADGLARLDRVGDLLTNLREEVEAIEAAPVRTAAADQDVRTTRRRVRAPPGADDDAGVEALRAELLDVLRRKAGAGLVRHSRTEHENATTGTRYVVLASSPYENIGPRRYWYGYRKRHRSFLAGGRSGHLVLGMVGRRDFLMIPVRELDVLIPDCNVSERGEASHWHLILGTSHGVELHRKRPKPPYPLEKFLVTLERPA